MNTIEKIYQLPKSVTVNAEKLKRRVDVMHRSAQCIIEYRDERGMAYIRAIGRNYDDAFWRMKGLLENDAYGLEY